MLHSFCRYCGIQLDGQSGLCIRCWGLHLQPCLQCMRKDRKGRWVPKSRWVTLDDNEADDKEAADHAGEEPRRRKRQLLRDSCSNCGGKGWLLDLAEPAADPAIALN
jgi:hypothetical protein